MGQWLLDRDGQSPIFIGSVMAPQGSILAEIRGRE
jgi:hypothetical protein